MDPSAQSKEIQKLIKQEKLQQGDAWYLISTAWWQSWKTWSSKPSKNYCGPINNKDLVDETNYTFEQTNGLTILKEGKQENYDYVLVSKPVWTRLQEWHGGGPEIMRFVIVEEKSLRVETVLTQIKGKLKDQETVFFCGKCDKLKELKERICLYYKIPTDRVRLWTHYDEQIALLKNESKPIDELQFCKDQVLVCELRNEDDTWPYATMEQEVRNSTSNAQGASVADSQGSSSTSLMKKKMKGMMNALFEMEGVIAGIGGSSKGKGLTGLVNLGNTCYMNSAIQCLSNCTVLTRFFLSGEYKHDLNRKNPLGCKGAVAETYAELINSMWAQDHSVTTPRAFKNVISKFAPRFAGMAQHDSQEMLQTIMDGLHEDLNRIKVKPYTETKDEEGLSDAELSEKFWKLHLSRNQSIIVDNFHGQLKSTITCPECNKISITFDPFVHLQVPLPCINNQDIPIEVTFIPLYNKVSPMKYIIMVPRSSTVARVKEGLGEQVGWPPARMSLARLSPDGIDTFYKEAQSVTNVRTGDKERTVAFQLLPKSDKSYLWLQITARKKEKNKIVSLRLQRMLKKPAVNGDEANKPKGSKIREFKELTEEDDLNFRFDFDHIPPPDKEMENEDWKLYEKLATFPFKLFYARLASSDLSEEEIIPNDETSKIDESGKKIILEFDEENWHNVVDENNWLYIRESDSWKKFKSKTTTTNSQLTIEDCLTLFSETERLGASDMWYCPKCKTHRRAFKKLELWKAPPFLIVHLKRFRNLSKYSREKITNLLQFPVNGWDISPFVGNLNDKKSKATLSNGADHNTKNGNPRPSYVYDLIAISNHSGGLSGGHYTAFALNDIDKKWYHFNDSSVSIIDPSSLVSPAAYILFYKMRA